MASQYIISNCSFKWIECSLLRCIIIRELMCMRKMTSWQQLAPNLYPFFTILFQVRS